MKDIKIKNKADIPYEIIGVLIDYYLKQIESKEYEPGWIQYFEFEYKRQKYTAYIEYMNKHIELLVIKNS